MNSSNGAFRILLSATWGIEEKLQAKLHVICCIQTLWLKALSTKVSRAFHWTLKHSHSFVLIPRIQFLLPYISIVIYSGYSQSPALFYGCSLPRTHEKTLKKICRMTPDNITEAPWFSGHHYCTTSFNKAWSQVLRTFISCSWCVRDSRWWGSLRMVLAENKPKRLSSINHSTKTTHHLYQKTRIYTAQNMKFPIKDFFSK